MDVGGTDAPLDEKLLPFISEIAPNESEIRFISGVDPMRDGKLEKDLLRKAVAALKAKFAAAGNSTVEVLLTLGSHGSLHFGSQWANGASEDIMGLLPHETQMGVFRLETSDGRPKDTTGAGDCFRGSYVAARYGEGESLQQAMKWASAASSLSVEVHGAMPSMPDRKTIQARAAKDVLSGLGENGAVEMKVTLKRSTMFYIKSARSFLKGIEARPADGERKAVEAKPAVSGLRISGLGQACGVAIAAASQIVDEKLGRVQSIKTAYPNLSGKSCPQVIIDIVPA
jgi:hypothetical protein